ncbi:hypothetical protein BDM02DRAFT_3271637 [Thelephora ganbajun]|uniref:Uncharacterized protein n=1 Tax=Thelephora ganbajun TaxID=370292 RepID=A0ACB6Z747_THEGA|nr:hypothetical protein BDM02DRAFT_3271637 [Thelephora ganbajun]
MNGEKIINENGGPTFVINEIPATPGLDAMESQINSPRARVHSTPGVGARPLTIGIPTSQSLPPTQYHPPSAGPYNTSFGNRANLNGNGRTPLSHSSHSRTKSLSMNPKDYSPPLRSPLSNSFSPSLQSMFPPPPDSPSFKSFAFPQSVSAPDMQQRSLSSGQPNASRRHTHNRIHSRNLSVFFPRPGTLPQPTIEEDSVEIPAPVTTIRERTTHDNDGLRAGFRFGGVPSSSDSSLTPSSSSGSRPSRRGHHHKHSMSHNFFSFLEPGSQRSDTAASSGPPSASSTMTDFADSVAPPLVVPTTPVVPTVDPLAVVSCAVEAILGAAVWVTGQQTGSLSCTGLGYWVVFDSFGVALSRIIPGYLARDSMQSRSRRTYGNGRLETVLMFAQSVYLIFASVYICKETVEHLLLSAGDDQQHHADHHHHSDGGVLPIVLAFLSLILVVVNALRFDNHSKLVEVTGSQLPQLTSLLPSTRTSFHVPKGKKQQPTPIDVVFSNPFSLSPIAFSIALVFPPFFLPDHQIRSFDLFLAAVQALVTFSVAYPASVALGSVLLQTSPARGLTSGRMEAFLRVMKEIEKHPQVLHLPPPHIWQLTPSTPTKQSLVVTLELHVREDLDDDDVLKLSKWAWNRCVSAMGFGRNASRLPEDVVPEVTVGVVKG